MDRASGLAEKEAGSTRLTSGVRSPHAFAEWMLEFALLIVCCALTVSNGLLQAFMVTSDQLTVPSFVEDLLRNPHFTPFTWMIPRAPYAFPDLPGYFLVRLVNRRCLCGDDDLCGVACRGDCIRSEVIP